MQTISEIKLGSLFSQQFLLTKVDTLGRSAGRSEIHDCIQAIKGIPQTLTVPLTLKIVREGIMVHRSYRYSLVNFPSCLLLWCYLTFFRSDIRFEREKRNYEAVCGSATGSRLPHFVSVQRFEKNAKTGTNCIVMVGFLVPINTQQQYIHLPS